MATLLLILAVLASGIAALAIAYALGARVPPTLLAAAAFAILVAAGMTLVRVVIVDMRGAAGPLPHHHPVPHRG